MLRTLSILLGLLFISYAMAQSSYRPSRYNPAVKIKHNHTETQSRYKCFGVDEHMYILVY